MKTSVCKEKVAIFEYLCENEKFRETVYVCSYWAQVDSFKQQSGQKSRDTVSLRIFR